MNSQPNLIGKNLSRFYHVAVLAVLASRYEIASRECRAGDFSHYLLLAFFLNSIFMAVVFFTSSIVIRIIAAVLLVGHAAVQILVPFLLTLHVRSPAGGGQRFCGILEFAGWAAVSIALLGVDFFAAWWIRGHSGHDSR